MDNMLRDRWLEAVARKKSLLCVGLDPAEAGQRKDGGLSAGRSKLEFCLAFVEQVAPFAAAIKPNRNYLKDFSRQELAELNRAIHDHGMISIDDSKLADIGDTNDAGFYHAAQEGFDAVTYAPFPGNVAQAAEQARARGVALIVLVLMSNPEFEVMKNARFGDQKGFEFFAEQVRRHSAEGLVIGAPSEKNHITVSEIERVKAIVGERVVLVPGIGHQGGELGPILASFGRLTIANVGRAILHAANPAEAARSYRDMIQAELSKV